MAAAERSVTDLPNLCRHDSPYLRSCRKYFCPVCKSFWDLDVSEQRNVYDLNYPMLRHHFDSDVGTLKTESLQSWLSSIDVDIVQSTVCEVGFGGGFPLKFVSQHAQNAYGIEVIRENIEHAVTLGLKRDNLFSAEALPEFLPVKIDLWLFLDSFEHIPDPSGFIVWLVRNSNPGARILLVSPEAASFSETVMGQFWPHRVKDHPFHWSAAGVKHFLSLYGFALDRVFTPKKVITLKMIISHVLHKFNLGSTILDAIKGNGMFNIPFRFNIGEMGLLFRLK